MLIPKETITEVLEAAKFKLPEIISDHLQLKKSGTSYVADCPFCGKQKKFSVSNKFPAFRCWSCNKSGNAVTFFMEVKGKSYPDAIHSIAEKVNILI